MVVSTLFYWSSTVFNVIVKSTLTVFKPEPIQLWLSLVADFQWLLGAIYFPMPMKSESSPIRYIDPQDWYQRCNNQNTVGVRKWVKNWRRWPIENGWKMGFSLSSTGCWRIKNGCQLPINTWRQFVSHGTHGWGGAGCWSQSAVKILCVLRYSYMPPLNDLHQGRRMKDCLFIYSWSPPSLGGGGIYL